ncbi:hypothetical protein MNV49_007365 [Pseudohyphozyma bogoriensis]|nr:hypothetical protein MNV49_007365 [Pseudohyphozyma bogoriensis]
MADFREKKNPQGDLVKHLKKVHGLTHKPLNANRIDAEMYESEMADAGEEEEESLKKKSRHRAMRHYLEADVQTDVEEW